MRVYIDVHSEVLVVLYTTPQTALKSRVFDTFKLTRLLFGKLFPIAVHLRKKKVIKPFKPA